jgi:hypothetical protein
MARTEELTLAEEEILFYLEIGSALTGWANVEYALFQVLAGGFENDLNRRALGVGFFTLEGARAKREFAEATVGRVIAGHPLRPQWIQLIERIRSATTARNHLAHWKVMMYERASPGRRYALEHWIQPKRKPLTSVPRPRPGALCLRDIVKVRLEFMALRCALENFHARLARAKEPYPAFDEQPRNLPQIGQLRRQMLATLARILQPSEEKP